MFLPKQTPAVLRNPLANISLQGNSVEPNQMTQIEELINHPTINILVPLPLESILCQFVCERWRQRCINRCPPPIIPGETNHCRLRCQAQFIGCISGCF